MDPPAGIEARVFSHLNELGVPYEVLPCDPELADTRLFCEHYRIDPDVSANTILIVSKRPPGRYALCVTLATTRLDVNHRVRELLDCKKLSFASADETTSVTGMMLGGVTPFAVESPDVPIYIDQRVLERDEIVLGGGSRSCKIRISPEVFHRLAGAKVVTDLALS